MLKMEFFLGMTFKQQTALLFELKFQHDFLKLCNVNFIAEYIHVYMVYTLTRFFFFSFLFYIPNRNFFFY